MWSTGINRNIVECKDCSDCVDPVHILVLIETLWNVKFQTGFCRSYLVSVLIETLWNVKSDMAELMAGEEAVLIETLWNVKVDSDGNYTEFPEY